MKYVNQLLYPHIPYITRWEMETEEDREKGKHTTVRSSGCGLCAAVMVADWLLPNCTFELEDALELAVQVGAGHRLGTDYARFAPAFAEKLGLSWEPTDDPEALRQCLRTGGAAVIHVDGDREGHIGVFTHGAHYITAISVDTDGRIVILDPSYKEGKFEEEGRKGLVEIKNGVLALCTMEVLVEETIKKYPGFHLFRRK